MASGRRHGLTSSVTFARATFPLLFASRILMRRSGGAVAGCLACRSGFRLTTFLTIFGVAVGSGRDGRISSDAIVAGMMEATATASRTYVISNLSASVKVSHEKASATVGCAAGVTAIGSGVEVPALTATTAAKPPRQRPANHTVLITASPALFEDANWL